MAFQLLCIAGESAPAALSVDGPVELGRDPHCDLRLLGEGASRFHVRLEPRAAGVEVRDNGSRNGTWVDGRRIERELLGDGAVFTAGGCSFLLADTASQLAETRVVSDAGMSLGVTCHRSPTAIAATERRGALPVVHEVLRELAATRCAARSRSLAESAARIAGTGQAAVIRRGSVSAHGMSSRLARRLAAGREARLLQLGRELVGQTVAREEIGSALTVPLGTDGHLVVARGVGHEPLGRELLPVLALLAEGAAPLLATAEDAAPTTIVGSSEAMAALRRRIARLATSDATVLVTGESGTGKELVAQALHRASGRSAAPLVTVNCAALPEGLVESELFGHLKGAFTGAVNEQPGSFRAADGGTLFLDEIGELPLPAQAKLLRALQDGVVDPVGAARGVRVDVRLIAATNRDLSALVAAGGFREDLYYRLDVLRIHTPALREHAEDIPDLCAHLLPVLARDAGVLPPTIDPAALRALSAARWPGNVRQLINCLTRAVVLSEGRIEARHLEREATTATDGGGPSERFPTLAEVEARHIAAALGQTGWNKSQAARMLGISRPTINKKIGDYGIEPAAG